MGPNIEKNEARKILGWQTLAEFARINKSYGEPDEDNLTDLLADLLHAFGLEVVETSYRRAGNHYRAEINGEDD